MKKFLTLFVLSTIAFACNNSADTSTTAAPAATTDTVGRSTPPPMTLDTPTIQSDTAKVKRAIKK